MQAFFSAWRDTRHFLAALVVVWAFGFSVSEVQAQRPQLVPNQVESVVYPGSSEIKAFPPKFRRAGEVPLPKLVLLGPVSQERLATEKSVSRRPGNPPKIGFGRELTELSKVEDTAAHLNWQDIAQGGKAAAISITSPQAKGLRLGILIEKLPVSAVLRFYPQKGGAAMEISGSEILKLIKINLAAGDSSENARVYWAPYFEGEEVTVEIDLPPDIDPDAVSIAIPRISHMFRSFLAPESGSIEKIGESAACEVDVSCYADWSMESKATARMLYTAIDGSGWWCTGTLLNDAAMDYTPYFLSANHCISDQTTASTLITYWFYRSTACYSGMLNPESRTLSSGATLLYASAATDTSFMMLNSAPPAGAAMAGWSASAQPVGTAVTGVHHPEGDLQKISFGSVRANESCTNNPYNCNLNPAGNFLQVNFSAGITEHGSSGSGLFMQSGGRHFLIGQLFGGPSGCTYTNRDYGRFDLAYDAAISKWLNPGDPDGVLKEYLYRDGSYFYSALPAEQQTIESGQLGPGWSATGNSFKVWIRAKPAGGYPVCRFRGDNITVSGWGHFYTALPSECTAVRNGSAPFWLYEGTGYYAFLPSGSCPQGTITIYRQYNPRLHNHHFQTSNLLTAEMEAAGWTMEGIPFCVGM